jgi:hypothetical protein
VINCGFWDLRRNSFLAASLRMSVTSANTAEVARVRVRLQQRVTGDAAPVPFGFL